MLACSCPLFFTGASIAFYPRTESLVVDALALRFPGGGLWDRCGGAQAIAQLVERKLQKGLA